ncbi:MAG: leucine-rich repeat domain-containing protein [Candidatus Kariarchaeaceae archaeon]|jgi:Leucine-rich repeat (LRR) protein
MSGYTEYQGVWLHTAQARAMQEMESLIRGSIPDISENTLGSFGFLHDNYHVIEVRLFQSYFNQDFQLSELPESIGDLERLHTLDASHNQLDRLPARIAELEELENCYLDYNNFREFPKMLSELEFIRQLNFDDNLLTGISPSISGINSLQSLHVAGNLLTKIPSEVQPLLFLRRLDLRRNLITSLDFNIINDLSQLYVLDVRGNLIPDVDADKTLAFLKLQGKTRRKYRLKGELSALEDPFSLRNIRKKIESDPFIDTPHTDEELDLLARDIKLSHEQKYRQTDGIIT